MKQDGKNQALLEKRLGIYVVLKSFTGVLRSIYLLFYTVSILNSRAFLEKRFNLFECDLTYKVSSFKNTEIVIPHKNVLPWKLKINYTDMYFIMSYNSSYYNLYDTNVNIKYS